MIKKLNVFIIFSQQHLE